MKQTTEINLRLTLPAGMTFAELALHLEQAKITAQHVPMPAKRKPAPLNCHIAKILPFRSVLA